MDLLIIRILFVGTGDAESGSSVLESLCNTQKDVTGKKKVLNSSIQRQKNNPFLAE